MRGLGASPSQSFSSLTSLPIFLPQPLGSEAFKSLSQVCPGPSFIPVGPDRGFGRAQRAILKLSYPKAPRHGWAHFFLALSLSLPTPLLLLRPLSYSPFSPLPKDMPSPCALHSSLLHLSIPFPPHSSPHLSSPGQADAIGASSLRDPVPNSSLVYLLLTPPLVSLWTPGPKSQC